MKKINFIAILLMAFFILTSNVNATATDQPKDFDDKYIYNEVTYYYKETNYVQTQQEADELIAKYGTNIIEPEKYEPPKEYPYFVGFNNSTHKAIYSNEPQPLSLTAFASETFNVKATGTWKVGSNWGTVMKDNSGIPFWCADNGKNYPTGLQKFTKSEHTPTKRALSYGPNGKSITNTEYGKKQLAYWKARGAKIDVVIKDLGEQYLNVYKGYKGTIGENKGTLTMGSGATTSVANYDGIPNQNVSSAIKVSGTAKFGITAAELKKLTDNKINIYLKNKSTSKWSKMSANTLYSVKTYNYLRFATPDMSSTKKVSKVHFKTDINLTYAYMWDNGKSGDQKIVNYVKHTEFEDVNTSAQFKNQVGDIKVLKTNSKFGSTANATGVEFGLFKTKADAQANKNVVKKATTNASGEAFFKGLLPATYYVKELKGNANFIASTHIASAKVTVGSTATADGNPNVAGVNPYNNIWGLGNIEGYKVLDDFDRYETAIKDEAGNPILLTSNGQPVTFIDDDYSMEVATYPSKAIMIEKGLFEQPIVVLIPEYKQVYEEVQKLDENGNPIPVMIQDEDEHGNPIVDGDGAPIMIEKKDEHGNVIYETEEVPKIDEAGNTVVKAVRDEAGNIIFNSKTLDLKYPSKRVMDNIIRLGDVTFTLYDSNRKEVKSVKTNANGEIKFNDLKPGKYFIKETATLEGLQLSEKEYPIIVENNKTVFINDKKEIINIPEAGKLKVIKKDTLDNVLEGITFTIYAADENGNADLNDVIDVVTTNDKGEAYFDYYPGKYFVKELTGSARHEINTDLHFTELEKNETTVIEIENDIKVNESFISKVDFGNDKELPGAKMCLTAKDKDYFFLKTKDGKRQEVKSHCWTSTDKPYLINLEPKEYIVTEKIAPEGYVKATTTIPFEVLNDDQALNAVKVQNRLIENDVKISKTDATGEKELEGAKMCLYEKETDKKLECWTSTKEAKKMQLKYGSYYIIEKIAPKGYIKVETNIPIIVNKDGKVQHVKVKNEAIKYLRTGGIKNVSKVSNKAALESLDKVYSFQNALN